MNNVTGVNRIIGAQISSMPESEYHHLFKHITNSVIITTGGNFDTGINAAFGKDIASDVDIHIALSVNIAANVLITPNYDVNCKHHTGMNIVIVISITTCNFRQYFH